MLVIQEGPLIILDSLFCFIEVQFSFASITECIFCSVSVVFRDGVTLEQRTSSTGGHLYCIFLEVLIYTLTHAVAKERPGETEFHEIS
jgi:hypothetical protein